MQCVFNGDIEYRTDDDDDAADDDDEILEYLWLFGERNIDGKKYNAEYSNSCSDDDDDDDASVCE